MVLSFSPFFRAPGGQGFALGIRPVRLQPEPPFTIVLEGHALEELSPTPHE